MLVPTVTVTQDAVSFPISLSGTDTDVADLPLLSILITTLPLQGTLYIQNGTAITAPTVISTSAATTVTYQTFKRGVDQFEYQVQDPLGALSLPVIIPIAITNFNHPPVAHWTGMCSGNEDTTITVSQMSATDDGADDTPASLSIYISSPPSVGTFTQANGSVCSGYPCLVQSPSGMLYTPPSNANGNPYTSFMFYAVDSHGMRSLLDVTGLITVVPVDDAPVATNTSAVGLENTNITVVVVHAHSTTDVASCSLVVIPVTQAPTCSVSLGFLIMVPKSSSTSVSMNAKDPDNGETYTFYLLSFQAKDSTGVLTGPNGQITSSSNKVFATIPSAGTVTPAVVTYTLTGTITSF